MERYSDPECIYNYKYQSISHSLFDRVFRYWLDYSFRFVPPQMSANLLSMIGNLGSWFALILMIAFGSNYGVHHRHLFAIAGLSVAFYHTVDNLDGRQARRIGSSGPLGEFVDHWFDSFNVFFFPLGALAAFPVLPAHWAIAIIVICSLADWMTLREVMKTNVMYFGHLSTDEGIFLYWAFLLSVFFFGYDFWALPHPVLGFRPIYLLFAAFVLSCSSVIVKTLVKYRGMGLREILAEVAVMSPVILWIHTVSPIFGRHFSLVTGLLVIGFIGSRHVGDLLRARLVGLKYPILFADLTACSAFVLVVSLVHRYLAILPAWLLLLPIVILLVDTVQALVLQFLRTVRRVYDCLGIPLFGAGAPEEIVAIESLTGKV